MVALKVLVILFLLNQSHAKVNCSNNQKFVDIREHLRGFIDVFGSFYTIVDFLVLKNYSKIPPKSSHLNNLEFLVNFDIPLTVPPLLAFNSKTHLYEAIIFSNQKSPTIGSLNVTYGTLDFYREFLKSEQCTFEIPQHATLLKDNWEDPHCFLMFACKLFKSPKGYKIKKQILILADQEHNRTTINRYLSRKDYIQRFLNFTEFGEHHGWCMCDKLAYYINDCNHFNNVENLEMMLPHFGVILLTLIALFLTHEVYCYIMEY